MRDEIEPNTGDMLQADMEDIRNRVEEMGATVTGFSQALIETLERVEKQLRRIADAEERKALRGLKKG